MKDLKAQGLGLATISYDPVETLAAFSKQHETGFPMLSDAGSATIRKFGILNPVPEWAAGPDKDDPAVKAEINKYVSAVGARPNMVGMSFPGTFLLDKQGRVKQRFFEDFYIERNTVSNLLLKTGQAAGKTGDKSGAILAATRISTGQVDITTWASNPAIAPGDRFSLVLDVRPHAKIHVYAPGASGYRVIALKLDPNSQFRFLAPRFPDSEIYFFQPLNERVPVFRKPFRLLQELILDGSPEAQAALRGKESVTVHGVLEYQACDDKECFNPVSVPLAWTLTLRSLVTQRPSAAR